MAIGETVGRLDFYHEKIGFLVKTMVSTVMNKEVSTDVQLTGSCYCQQVKYKICGPANANYLCHCEQCRKFTGSAHAANMQIKSSFVQFTEGEECISTFSCPSGRAFSKAFCKVCGSGLPFVGQSGEYMYVPIGGLDKAPDSIINYNIFWEDRANWYDAALEQPTCEGFPPTT